MNLSRVNNKWPVAREGLPFILTGILLTVLFSVFGWHIPTFFLGFMTIFVIYFFRDPGRTCSCPEDEVVAPADGRIVKIQEIEDETNPLGEPAILVSIFMNLFNVHVNRVPVSGTIEKVDYHPGKFFSANLDKASLLNERNCLILETRTSRRIAVTQIAGLVARRIVCWAGKGDRFETGQRFGLIRFGSRLDVHLPKNSEVTVRMGQKVKAGQTVIGRLT
ncbi:MAG: phosphatidylserine decarboxylase family protein [Desulfatiglandaceae bacterium]|jgi:phosphatidylserine decarboxylase